MFLIQIYNSNKGVWVTVHRERDQLKALSIKDGYLLVTPDLKIRVKRLDK